LNISIGVAVCGEHEESISTIWKTFLDYLGLDRVLSCVDWTLVMIINNWLRYFCLFVCCHIRRDRSFRRTLSKAKI